MTERDKKWNRQYEQLVEFKRKHGHCDVPRSYERDKSLWRWVTRQRKRHADNKLRQDQKMILTEIGFFSKDDQSHTLNQDDKLWHQNFEKLVEFKRKNGQCLVPKKYEQDKSLGNWVHTQRYCHNNNRMRQDRKTILDEIGFAWKDDGVEFDKLWHQQFKILHEYKRINGHCKVPQTKNKSLGLWVKNQRARHANNKMLPDRKELLDALDFAWKAEIVAIRSSTSTENSDSVAFTSSVGLPNEALKESDQAPAHVKHRSECPSPNRKRPSTSLVESGGMGARTNQRGKASASSSSVEENGVGRDEEDSKPSLVTSSAARIAPHSDQEVVQEQATTLGEIPHGWIRIKLEPDC